MNIANRNDECWPRGDEIQLVQVRDLLEMLNLCPATEGLPVPASLIHSITNLAFQNNSTQEYEDAANLAAHESEMVINLPNETNQGPNNDIYCHAENDCSNELVQSPVSTKKYVYKSDYEDDDDDSDDGDDSDDEDFVVDDDDEEKNDGMVDRDKKPAAIRTSTLRPRSGPSTAMHASRLKENDSNMDHDHDFLHDDHNENSVVDEGVKRKHGSDRRGLCQPSPLNASDLLDSNDENDSTDESKHGVRSEKCASENDKNKKSTVKGKMSERFRYELGDFIHPGMQDPAPNLYDHDAQTKGRATRSLKHAVIKTLPWDYVVPGTNKDSTVKRALMLASEPILFPGRKGGLPDTIARTASEILHAFEELPDEIDESELARIAIESDGQVFQDWLVKAQKLDDGYYKSHLRDKCVQEELQSFKDTTPLSLQAKKQVGPDRQTIGFISTQDGQSPTHFDEDVSLLILGEGSKTIKLKRLKHMKRAATVSFHSTQQFEDVDPFTNGEKDWLTFELKNPGDALLIPKEWVHAVRSTAGTIAFSVQIEPRELDLQTAPTPRTPTLPAIDISNVRPFVSPPRVSMIPPAAHSRKRPPTAVPSVDCKRLDRKNTPEMKDADRSPHVGRKHEARGHITVMPPGDATAPHSFHTHEATLPSVAVKPERIARQKTARMSCQRKNQAVPARSLPEVICIDCDP